MLSDIIKAESIIKSFPQLDIETLHSFDDDVYCREIRVKAGSIITGKIHLTEHLAVLVSGTMTILSEYEAGTLTGPLKFMSKPGVKRLGIAHTDCVFRTYHKVGDERDIETIEKKLVVESPQEFLELQL